MNLKQLFCKHIYKTFGQEFLRHQREPLGRSSFIVTYATFSYYSIKDVCTKCGKVNIHEEKFLNLG